VLGEIQVLADCLEKIELLAAEDLIVIRFIGAVYRFIGALEAAVGS
jgi:hypothetical protein